MRNRLAVPAALLGLSALVLAACSSQESGPARAGGFLPSSRHESPVTPAAQAQVADAPGAPIPLIAADGPTPRVSLSTTAVYQGGALLVTAANASSGAVTVLGRTVPMQRAGGELVAIVGFGTEDPPGSTYLSLDLQDATGEWMYVARGITVVRTEWTVDYIIIPPPPPPDPNAPPPPPPPPDENPLLPAIYAGITAKKWQAGWAPPLPEPLRVTGYFGEQRSFNGGPVQGHHGGTDFGADFGTPVSATNDGVVVMSGLYRTRGELVVIDHGLGVFSLYGHMQARTVQVGAVVTKGQVIGFVGSTGLSTGAHLHWEMSVFGVLVDGLRWLDGSQGF